MRKYSMALWAVAALLPLTATATVFGSLRGIVHDPDPFRGGYRIASQGSDGPPAVDGRI